MTNPNIFNLKETYVIQSGDQLKSIRKKLRITQAQLADEADIIRQTIIAIEAGKKDISTLRVKDMERLVNALIQFTKFEL